MIALGFYFSPEGTLLVLAGEGNFLKVFEAESSKLICLIKVFKAQSIHGILVRDVEGQDNALQIAIWGGYSLTLLRKLAFEALLSQNLSSIEDIASPVSDWVLDVAISPYDDSCVVVTAHNTVFRARIEKLAETIQLETLSSPSRSILYSAHLVWESSTCVLVAAGTVFGEIIAWQCFVSDETSTADCLVLATLTGHEGSIFGVNISPPILGLYDKPIRLLASCSDDRTIRIWDIHGDRTGGGLAESLEIHDSVALRETGFGDNGQRERSQHATNPCLAIVMGHVSRIWRVKFQISDFDRSEPSSIRLLSLGEDSTVQQWELVFGSEFQPQTTLSNTTTITGPGKACWISHLNTFAFHSGKHIWSTAMHKLGDTRTILITGGADGKISSYEIPLSCSSGNQPLSHAAMDEVGFPLPAKSGTIEPLPQLRALCLDDVLGAVTPSRVDGLSTNKVLTSQVLRHGSPTTLTDSKLRKKIKLPKPGKDTFNRYAFVSDNLILVTTNFGRVLLGEISSSIKWEELPLPDSGKEDLKSYSIIKGVPELGVAFLVGATGNIYLYRIKSKILKVAEVVGKVIDVFTLFHHESESLNLVVTTLGGKDAILCTLELHTTSAITISIIPYCLPEKFIVTSVGKSRDILVFGARNGSLAIYDMARNSEALETWKPDEVDNLGDAITSITHLQSPNCDQDYFLTTGRNGMYFIYVVTVTRQEQLMIGCTIRQVHRGTPPLGPNIEAAWFQGPDLLLYGFKSKNFIVWNETKQCEIVNIECGGAHRSHAYSPVQNSHGGHFIYTKASKLYVHSWRNPAHRIIKNGGHGREIKACAISPDQNLIATGAEDTAIRIWRYEEDGSLLGNHFECIAVVQKHTAGIQHLQWYGSKYLFSSAGNEEFFIWAVESIPDFGMGVVCEASYPDPSEDRDLRIMSFDVTGDSRLLGEREEPQLFISMAFSDSTFRTYKYSRSSGFKLMASGRYTSSCLLQLRHIRMAGEELYLLTTATDGNIVIWKSSVSRPLLDIPDQPVQTSVLLSNNRLHQNAIKSLDVRISSSTGKIIVATGGDDNALGVSIYDSADLSLEPRRTILRSAHAAAITGLCFVHGGRVPVDDEETLRILSSSNDQRVKEWGVGVGGEGGVGIEMVGNAFTSVADVGDLAGFSEGRIAGDAKVLIVGNGMEVFNVSCE